MDTGPIMEGNTTTGEERLDTNKDAILDLTTEFHELEDAIFPQEHTSGIIVVTLWLIPYACLRYRLSLLPLPIPLSSTLLLVLATLVSLTLTTPACTFTGLTNHTYIRMSSSLTKGFPAWLPHAIPVALLFPIARAATLLFVLVVWETAGMYRNGVARVTEEANQVIHRAVSAAEKAGEHLREAKGLEMQAMQLAAMGLAGSDDGSSKTTTAAEARDVKAEVEGLVKEVGMLGPKVDKVRKLAERAQTVAGEGDVELAGAIVVNARQLVERAVQGPEKVIRGKVEGVKQRFWRMSLGKSSG